MFRKTAWRNAASDSVSFHQDQALNTTIFLLKSFGPTGFLLREEGETRNFKVCLGDPHTCTCPVFTREQEPCKHICWVLLRKFRLPREHEYSFQHGLVDRQILEVLHGLHQTTHRRTENAPSAASGTPSQPVTGQKDGSVCRKGIQAQDVCPICQEELLQKKQPVSYCRFSCGNNVHISCMKVWADHQNLSDINDTVKCPLCREDFGSLKLLQEQMINAAKLFTAAEREKPDRHLGVVCHSCRVCPITGKCFKCTVCTHFYLCEDCSKKGCHPQHPFASRTKRREKWHLVAEELSDGMRGASSLPVNDSIIPVAADPLPEHALGCLPAVKVGSGSWLLDVGQQCRICLLDFNLGQRVRTLPCHHKFHADCVDEILRKSNSCPVDGYVIYNPLTWRAGNRKTSPKLAKQPENNLKDLFIPGVALRDRNTKELIPDRLQNAAADTVTQERKRELQRKQTLLIPENESDSSKKSATKQSPASPNRSAAGTKNTQPDLFVGSPRLESDHAAPVGFAARQARTQPKRTGVATTNNTNDRLISELRMTGVLINLQQQRETET